jgi:glucosylceramidase
MKCYGYAAIALAASVAHGAQVEWVCSTEKQPWQEMPAPVLKAAEAPPVVFMKPSRTFQTIDGFGGSFNELGWTALSKAPEAVQKKVLEALFGDEGCAFTLARIPIGASDFALGYYSLDDTPEDYALEHFSIERDRKHLLPYIKAAMEVRPDLQCWASPWTPPEWMKDNNFYSKGSLRWEPKVLNTFADYFSKWITAYRAEGVNLYAVSPQNEPNIDNNYTTCLWTGDQLAEFIGDYLGPTLKKQNKPIELWVGFNGDPIHGGENINDRLISVLEDPEANTVLTGIAYQYDSKNQIAEAYELYPDKKLMQSESKCFNGANSWGQALELYGLMKQYLDGGANQYFAWNMILNETGKSSWDWAQNALITVDQNSGEVTYNGEFYVYIHFGHFVKPGAKRIATTGWWSDRIAFQNPDGSIVLVLANSSNNAYETSITCADLSGNNTFSVNAPARSVNTFVLRP